MPEQEEGTKEKLLRSLNAPMFEAFEKVGLTMDALAKAWVDDSKIEDPDNPLGAAKVRSDCRKEIHKLLDHYPATKQEVSGSIQTVSDPQERAWLQAIKDKLLAGEDEGL